MKKITKYWKWNADKETPLGRICYATEIFVKTVKESNCIAVMMAENIDNKIITYL